MSEMAKYLIIEDDFELATSVASWLRSELHQVDMVSSGGEGLRRALSESFDAIILDVGLPDIDGFEVCRQLRQAGTAIFILMLTGKSHINDRITGLDLGADDYLTKPFSARELSARLRAMMRRPQAVSENTISTGDVTMELTSSRVLKNGQPVSLLPIDYALLEFLMRHPKEAFSSEQLLDKIWSADKHPTDNAVRSAIKRLRKGLGEDIVETISKVGYRLKQG